MRTLLLLACLLPAGAFAADILSARYDAGADQLVVDIAYRGTRPGHDFAIEWGACTPGGAVAARLIDRRGTDLAREGFRVTGRFGLSGLECRPARVTLRLGRVAHATVLVPDEASGAGAGGTRAEPADGFGEPN